MGIIEFLEQDGVVLWLGIISSILTILSFIGGFFTGKTVEKRKSTNIKKATLFFSNNNDIKQEK